MVASSPDLILKEGQLVGLGARLVVGREPGKGGLSVNDPAASRCHFALEWHERRGLLELTDQGSKNGTLVSAMRVERRFLAPGDVIRAGDTLFLVVGERPSEKRRNCSGVVGRSARVGRLCEELEIAAGGVLPTLLLGAPGTGKEIAARAVHDMSGRAGEFVAVNCPAVPETLFESTFFGHKKGAFADANADAPGLLRSAHKGTLFLDEVGELPLWGQSKLLRFLEDGIVRAVGDTREHKVDVRVIAATNADLDELESQRRFRTDLISRLEGFVVRVPPLSERREDIVPLVHHFASAQGITRVVFAADALEALLVAPWEQNVRGLRNVVNAWVLKAQHRKAVRNGTARMGLADLPDHVKNPVLNRIDATPSVELRGSQPTREELVSLLQAHDGNVAAVARVLGKDRTQIYRWMKQLEIER
jgi:transcriptional regulator with GAF, ATPase, and Fis domain